jgi:uncharacterized peroxidase-related enzyme
MNRLHSAPVSDATGHAAQLFAAIKAAAGMVPQAYVDIGSNSAPALDGALHLDAMQRQGTLLAQDVEIVKLAVSEVNHCDYCLAAHSFLGHKQGLDQARIQAVRAGSATGDARIDALVAFTRELVTTSGTLPAPSVAAIKAAGFTDAQIVDIVLAITSITFTNLFNRINDTAIDFPAAG